MTYFIADTHFGHDLFFRENFTGIRRPYSSVEQMNEALIRNWNEVVQEEDEVYHLGDFSFKNFEYGTRVLTRLKGCKHLILGNHDRTKTQHLWQGWDTVDKSAFLKLGSFNTYLSHKPQPLFTSEEGRRLNTGQTLHIHGHTHSDKLVHGPGVLCVSVEAISYQPIALPSLLQAATESFK